MARRREYVSFFSERPGRRLGRFGLTLPLLALAFVAVSVWWFVFRDTGHDLPEMFTLEEVSGLTLLLPEQPDDEPAAEVSFECPDPPRGWPAFQGTPTRTGCASAPGIATPRILWRNTGVGVQGWLNNPIIVEDTVYVGSAGGAQFVTDPRDGIYAVDLATGETRWFFGTEGDVNGVGYGAGVVVATGDEGRVWGVDAIDGDLVWTDDLESPTFGNPLIVEGMAVVGDREGRVTAYDLRSGDRRWQRPVAGAIRGGASSDGEMIVVAGEEGEVLALGMDGGELWRVRVRGRVAPGAQAIPWAAPTLVGDLVVVSLLRGENTYAEPALIALDRSDGSLVWESADAAGIKAEWGNVRSSPAVAGDLLVYGEPYSNLLVAVDLGSGRTRWAAEIGVFCFPQWSSPAVVGDQVIVPRFDGGVYSVSLRTRQLVWAIYLGRSESATGAFPSDWDDDFCQDLAERNAFSILASPAVSPQGIIVVGTLEGHLVAIGDRDWE